MVWLACLHAMTDTEAKKIAKVIGIKDISVDMTGIVNVNLVDGKHGPVFIYIGKSFRNALPLRILKCRQYDKSFKPFIEYLLKQSADGVGCIMIDSDCRYVNLIDAYETAETLLVKYDLKFYKKNRKAKKSKS